MKRGFAVPCFAALALALASGIPALAGPTDSAFLEPHQVEALFGPCWDRWGPAAVLLEKCNDDVAHFRGADGAPLPIHPWAFRDWAEAVLASPAASAPRKLCVLRGLARVREGFLEASACDFLWAQGFPVHGAAVIDVEETGSHFHAIALRSPAGDLLWLDDTAADRWLRALVARPDAEPPKVVALARAIAKADGKHVHEDTLAWLYAYSARSFGRPRLDLHAHPGAFMGTLDVIVPEGVVRIDEAAGARWARDLLDAPAAKDLDRAWALAVRCKFDKSVDEEHLAWISAETDPEALAVLRANLDVMHRSRRPAVEALLAKVDAFRRLHD